MSRPASRPARGGASEEGFRQRSRLRTLLELVSYFARRERYFLAPLLLVLLAAGVLLLLTGGLSYVTPFLYALFLSAARASRALLGRSPPLSIAGVAPPWSHLPDVVAGLFPGTMVTPTVRLVRPLRSGGMGSVWVAHHQGLQTQVAVKFLSAELASDPTSVARFAREAAAASQVKSPHVVQTFDHGVTSEGLPFIVMELLEGEDLTRRLQGGPLAPPTVAQIVTQIAKALTRAHEKGIVHRDIKPDNIFLCGVEGDELYTKLLDFGIAKGGLEVNTASGKTATGSLILH